MASTKVPIELSSTPGIVDNSNATAITIDSSENVGIGTTSPASFDAAGDNLVVGTGSGNNGMTVYSGTANAGSLFFADGTGTAAEKADGYIQYTHSNQALAFATSGGSEAMRIDSSGNVGIGTSSPSNKLTINSTTGSGLKIYAADQSLARLTLDNLNGQAWDLVAGTAGASNSGFGIYDGDAGATRLQIDSSGNVGIGTTSPTGAKLHVTGGVKATDLIAHDSTGINLQTDEGTKRLIIEDSGNVVINETGATADFRVESDANANALVVNADVDIVGMGTASSSSYKRGGYLNANAHILNSALIGAGYITIMINPNGRVFTLETAGNGAQAFLHLQGSQYNGYRDTYFWATNFSGAWTVYSNTNATSGTTPTYTIGSNSSQNPTITLTFATGYSGGYCKVFASPQWTST